MFFAVVVTVFAGCRSQPFVATDYHRWGWEDPADARAHLDQYANILLVRFDDDRWEDQGPHRYSLYDFRGTVLKTYEGDWRPTETGSFVEGLDYRAPKQWNSNAGKLTFIMTNQHSDAESPLDTGERIAYDPQLEQILKDLYP